MMETLRQLDELAISLISYPSWPWRTTALAVVMTTGGWEDEEGEEDEETGQ